MFAFTDLPDNLDLSIVVWNYKSSTFGSFEELILKKGEELQENSGDVSSLQGKNYYY